jgi:predicted KAP-like P-loop ATPase
VDILNTDRHSRFDVIYYSVREVWRALPLYWICVFFLAGLAVARVVPLTTILGKFWGNVVSANAGYFLSAILIALVLAAIFSILRRWALADRSTILADKDLVSKRFLLDDVPLSEGQSDELEREELSSSVAPLLVLPAGASSVVVAIEAGWGEGKSSFLHLIDKNLKRHVDDPVVVRFNPWFVRSREQVFRSFFSHLISAVDSNEKNAIEAIEALRSYARMLEVSLPFTGLASRAIEQRLEPAALADEKDRLVAALQVVGRPIVVIIDDIDRLPAKDIRCIFQLVKVVCDFKRVAYLLAFDPPPVDEALKFGGLYADGREYREKIVQLSLRLPRAAYLSRRKYFEIRLNQRIESWEFLLEVTDENVIEASTPLALRACTTPREMKRLLNAWCMSCHALRGEVNMGDILLLEVLQLKFPRVFEALERSPARVAGSGLFSYDQGMDADFDPSQSAALGARQEREKIHRALAELHPVQETNELIVEILDQLFPDPKLPGGVV